MKKRIAKLLIFAMIMGISAGACIPDAVATDVLIICNKNVPDASLSKDDIRNIFLGMKTEWSNGKKIVFVTLEDSDINESFMKDYLSKTPFQFTAYWRKQVFTGKGKPPKNFPDEAALSAFVANTDGAVGYVSPVARQDSVNVISVK
ncbi:MAG: hypothetical protein BWK80_30295 [Desulfobacteraceae bacterium IS3]|nr:MAG: hypothetical protein BWK80_30295 [Desulfobacteraceae bacterium IS3]